MPTRTVNGLIWYDDFSTDKSSQYVKTGSGSFAIDTANRYIRLFGDAQVSPQISVADCVIEALGARISSAGGDAWVVLVGRRQSLAQPNWYNEYTFQKKTTTNEYWIAKRVNGAETRLTSTSFGPVADDVFHLIKAKLSGSSLSYVFGSGPILSTSDGTFTSGYFALGSYAGEVRFKEFKVYSKEVIKVSGLAQGRVVVLFDKNNNVVTIAIADSSGVATLDISNASSRPPYLKFRIYKDNTFTYMLYETKSNEAFYGNIWGGDEYDASDVPAIPIIGIKDWAWRRTITIFNSDTVKTNYQIRIVVDTQTPISQNKMRSDGGDIRFSDSDGETILPHWIESDLNTPNTAIWIKVPNIPIGTKYIYMYYGRDDAIKYEVAKSDMFYSVYADERSYSHWWESYTCQGYLYSEWVPVNTRYVRSPDFQVYAYPAQQGGSIVALCLWDNRSQQWKAGSGANPAYFNTQGQTWEVTKVNIAHTAITYSDPTDVKWRGWNADTTQPDPSVSVGPEEVNMKVISLSDSIKISDIITSYGLVKPEILLKDSLFIEEIGFCRKKE